MDMAPLPSIAMPSAMPGATAQTAAQGAARSTEDPMHAKARKVAEDYESFFISMYLESMFEGVETDGLFGGGHAEKVYRSMLNQEVGKSIVQSGGIGIADSVMREIIKMQEGL
jgi:flagellar protein FlgJ